MVGRCHIVFVQIVFNNYFLGKFLRVLFISILKLVEMILVFRILLLEWKLVFIVIWVCVRQYLLVWLVLIITVFDTEIRIDILRIIGQYLSAVAGVVLPSELVQSWNSKKTDIYFLYIFGVFIILGIFILFNLYSVFLRVFVVLN